MKLENYELHLPSYSVGKEVYNQIGKICKPYGTKVLVIGGKKALSAAFDKISKNAERHSFRSLRFIRSK